MKPATQIEMGNLEGKPKVPHGTSDATAQPAIEDAAQTPPRSPERVWLFRCAVTTVASDDVATYGDFGLVRAQDILAAEDLALRQHVPEGFSESEPFEATDSERGEWTVWVGFRAFQLSEDHPVVDAGNIFWIDSIREVDAGDAAVLAKYLMEDLSWEQYQAMHKEQLSLRGIEFGGATTDPVSMD